MWAAMSALGYNHLDVPVWIDHILDEWVAFMKGEGDFDAVLTKVFLNRFFDFYKNETSKGGRTQRRINK